MPPVFEFLLILHVIAAIVAVGPVTVAASMFPPVLRRARAEPGAGEHLAVLRVLHRICRVYAAVGIAVPVLGVATALSLGVLGDGWLIVSMALTGAAAAVLVVLLPRQEEAIAAVGAVGGGGAGAGLAALTGVFNLLWAVVTALMIIRPGSTTGG